MKRFFILILLSFFSTIFAQETANRFKEGEEATYEHANDLPDNSTLIDSPQPSAGNPGDPVPIDGYLPVLLAVGVTIILLSKSKKFKKNSI